VKRLRGLPLLLCFGLGCHSYNSTSAGAAVGGLVYGVTGSLVSRASGGCYADCLAGDVCNPSTGWCEPNPCATTCGPGLRCDASGPVPHCVANEQPMADLRSPAPPPLLGVPLGAGP
jgi:hypothetical protein